MRRTLPLWLAAALLLNACSGGSDDGPGPDTTRRADGLEADIGGRQDGTPDGAPVEERSEPDDVEEVVPDAGPDRVEVTDSVADLGAEIEDALLDLPDGQQDVATDPTDLCPDLCQPKCEGKECGDDGCGGQCGECAEDEMCLDGLCVADCPAPDCDELGALQCASDSSFVTCISPGDPCAGSWFWSGTPEDCPPGTVCSEGVCLAPDPCALVQMGSSHRGCRFWSVDLGLYPDPYSPVQPDTAPHGLLVTNDNPTPVTVTLTTAAAGIAFDDESVAVCAGCTELVELPVMSLVGSVQSDYVVAIEASAPVAVVQVNPLDVGAAANDSSLLLPEHLLGQEYYVLSWPTVPLELGPIQMPSQHGYFTIVATAPGTTTVEVFVPVQTKAVTPGGEVIAAGQSGTFELAQHQALQLAADGGMDNGDYDLSGAVVSATQPVALLTGHEEAAVCAPDVEESCCADHLEEQLLPFSLWGTAFACVKAPPRSPADHDVWRVQAGAVSATLAANPAIDELDGLTLQPGEWVQVATDISFSLQSTAPIQVAQYLTGKECIGASLGDPALVVSVPVSLWGSAYTVVPVPGYDESWLTIVGPPDMAPAVDGEEVSASDITVKDDFAYAYLPVDGPAQVTGIGPFAVYAFGYALVAGTGHPGGLGQ